MAVGRVFASRQLNKFVYFYDDMPQAGLNQLPQPVQQAIVQQLQQRQLPAVVLLRSRHRPKWLRVVVSSSANSCSDNEERDYSQILTIGKNVCEFQYTSSTVTVLVIQQEQPQRQQHHHHHHHHHDPSIIMHHCPLCLQPVCDDQCEQVGTKLAAHIAGHVELLLCRVCGHTAQEKWQLLEHQLAEHEAAPQSVQLPRFVCEHCTRVFHSARTLHNHITTVHAAIECLDPPDLLCDHFLSKISDSVSDNHVNRDEEKDNANNNDNENDDNDNDDDDNDNDDDDNDNDDDDDAKDNYDLCSNSSSSFSRISTRSTRIVNRQQQKQQQQQQHKRFKCYICEKLFSSASSLSQHLATQHCNTVASISKLTCVHCDKVFSSRYQYLQHAKNVHPKFLFACPICCDRAMSFKQKSHLRKHLETRHRDCDVEALLASAKKFVNN